MKEKAFPSAISVNGFSSSTINTAIVNLSNAGMGTNLLFRESLKWVGVMAPFNMNFPQYDQFQIIADH